MDGLNHGLQVAHVHHVVFVGGLEIGDAPDGGVHVNEDVTAYESITGFVGSRKRIHDCEGAFNGVVHKRKGGFAAFAVEQPLQRRKKIVGFDAHVLDVKFVSGLPCAYEFEPSNDVGGAFKRVGIDGGNQLCKVDEVFGVHRSSLLSGSFKSPCDFLLFREDV